MDFTWVTSDDADAIQNTIVDAKGDLIAASASDVPARLAVGANGETLVADSSTSTGLRWTGTPSASNPLINSAFDVWQRGTSFAVPTNYSTYTADRYVAYRGGLNSGATISRQATNDTTNLPFIRYCLRYQRDSGNALTGDLTLLSGMETSDSIRYAGRTITFSFYARAGANYSPTSSLLNVRVDSGTGTDQAINTGYTGQVSVISSTATLTTTWQRFTFTGTVGATATELGFYTFASPTGTAGANDWYEVTGFQIDLGSVALPYRRNAGTIQGELAACQRYYYKHEASGTSNTSVGGGGYYGSTTYIIAIPFPVTMRVAPTLAAATVTNGYSVLTNGGLDNINSLTQETANTRVAQCYNNTEAASVLGYYGQLTSQNASTSLAWSAEL